MGPSMGSGTSPKPKKQFLKRRTNKVAPPNPDKSKSYNYYADNFEGQGAAQTREKRKATEEATTAATYSSKTSGGPKKF